MGVNGVTRLRSVNDISLSLVFVEFDWDTDIYQARQFVQERLTGVTETLPEGINPLHDPGRITDGRNHAHRRDRPYREKLILVILRTLADWTLSTGIRSVPGNCGRFFAMGGGVKQLQVQPLPNEMLALGVSFEEVEAAAAQAVRNTTGGFLTGSSKEVMVRNLAMSSHLDDIANTIVSYQDDRPIRISDVARVTWGVEPMRGDSAMGSKHLEHSENNEAKGYPGVILSVTKSPGFDTIDLTDRVEEKLEELQTALPEGAETVVLYRQADFIDIAIGNLEEALRDGAIMVAIVLFLFLFNFRVTFITLTAIPLSLAVSILVFDLMGLTVNSMTLGGFAVAIGMVVDDAIVDVENVFRRLREAAASKSEDSKLEIIAKASAEVRSSIFYATVLIILVFVPLLGLSGGRRPPLCSDCDRYNHQHGGILSCLSDRDSCFEFLSTQSQTGQGTRRLHCRSLAEGSFPQHSPSTSTRAAIPRSCALACARRCRGLYLSQHGRKFSSRVSRAFRRCCDDHRSRYFSQADHRNRRYGARPSPQNSRGGNGRVPGRSCRARGSRRPCFDGGV
jgi:Cu/Ag efflux pump CusA